MDRGGIGYDTVGGREEEGGTCCMWGIYIYLRMEGMRHIYVHTLPLVGKTGIRAKQVWRNFSRKIALKVAHFGPFVIVSSLMKEGHW